MNTAGIDVSAKTVTVVISREGHSGKPREFKNMPQGHTALSNVLRKAQVTRVCLEATGSYHLDLRGRSRLSATEKSHHAHNLLEK